MSLDSQGPPPIAIDKHQVLNLESNAIATGPSSGRTETLNSRR